MKPNATKKAKSSSKPVAKKTGSKPAAKKATPKAAVKKSTAKKPVAPKAAKKAAPKKPLTRVIAKKPTPTKAATKAAPKSVSAKKPTSKAVLSKKVTPKKVTPKKVTPKKVAPKKAAAKKQAPKKVASKKATPKKVLNAKTAAPKKALKAPAKKLAAKPVAAKKPQASPKGLKKPAAQPAATKKAAPKSSLASSAVRKPAAKAAAKVTAPVKAASVQRAPAAQEVSPVKSAKVPKKLKSVPATFQSPNPATLAELGMPVRTGRPSSRLVQLTVPSISQAVATTGAKASFTPMVQTQPIVSPAPSTVKKNRRLADNWQKKPVEQLSDDEVIAMSDDLYMNDVQLAFFRLKLLSLKSDILNNADKTTETLRSDTVIVPDPADRATIEEEHALELRTRDRERKLLKKIEQSIAMIDAGEYGFCDETGEPIGVGRLLARPTATLSLEAQQRRELKQKMFGD